MSDQSEKNAQKFRAMLTEKVQALLNDFAAGKISREQFHMLYERYNARMAIADYALVSGNPDAIAIAQTGPPTLQLIKETRARAEGIAIYHNVTGTLIEKLGKFEPVAAKYEPILKRYVPARPMAADAADPVHTLSKNAWLLFSPGRYSTVVTLFTNEPSKLQHREISRLHTDFETANRETLQRAVVDAGKLGYPFIVIVTQKFKK